METIRDWICWFGFHRFELIRSVRFDSGVDEFYECRCGIKRFIERKDAC